MNSIYNLEYLDTLIIKYWSALHVHAADLTEYSEGQLGWALSNTHAVSSLTDWDEWQTTQALFGRTMTYWEARDICNLLYENGQNVLEWNSPSLQSFIEYTKSVCKGNKENNDELNFSWEIHDSIILDKVLSGDFDNKYIDYHLASVYVGNLCIEMLASEQFEEDCAPIYVNTYLLNKDTGYGETDSGAPYDLTDAYCVISASASIKEFKRNAENAIKCMIANYNLSEEANKPFGDWD